MDSLSEFDLGPLTWVKGEIDNAFEAAASELARWNGSDETPLKVASAYLHQVYGALQIVDLQGVSAVCTEAEGLLADMLAQPESRNPAAAEACVKAIHVLRAYLDALMGGAANAEVALMPIYGELIQRRGGEAPAPSALFFPDTGARARRPGGEPEMDEESRAQQLRASRGKYQKGLVLILQNRDLATGLARMDEAVREVEAVVPGSAQYTFWWAVGGLMQALRQGNVELDIWVKRLCGRIDLQMRRLAEGSRQLAERLLSDVLYHLTEDRGGEGRASEARTLFVLDRLLPAAPLTAPDDALGRARVEMRDSLALALNEWIRAAAGRRESLTASRTALQRAHDLARELSPPLQALLAASLAAANAVDGIAELTGNEALQVELAAALLLAGDPDLPVAELEALAPNQAGRLALAADPEAELDESAGAPRLEAFAGQARDRLLLAQVTQSIQANLGQVEDVLERFFRDPGARADLFLVPSLMQQVQGEFNLLRLNIAADLVRNGMPRYAALAEPGRDIEADELNWIADSISSLGAYVEILRRGRDDPSALRAMLRQQTGDGAGGEESVEVAVRAAFAALDALAAQLPGAADPAAVRAELRAALVRLARDADLVGDRNLRGRVDAALKQLDAGASVSEAQAAVAAVTGKAGGGTAAAEAPAEILAEASGEAVDNELLQIYLEEAGTVLAEIDAGLARLQSDPAEREALVTIRRAFHTLKGSGRMVGLHGPAEIAWEVEQTLNDWLRVERAISANLLDFIARAAAAFKTWVGALSETGSVRAEDAELVAEARRLRAEETALATASDAETAAAASLGVAESAESDAPEAMVTVGEQRLPAALFDLFVAEADQHLATLGTGLRDLLASGAADAVWEPFVRAAHTLAGIARTTGMHPLADAAHALEAWAGGRRKAGDGLAPESVSGIEQVVARLGSMLAAIRAGTLPEPDAGIADLLAAAPAAALAAPPLAEPAPAAEPVVAEEIGEAADTLDAELLPIFLGEAEELLPRLRDSLCRWQEAPDAEAPRLSLQRGLHTLKGSARMTGAMRLGEAAHALETRIIERTGSAADPGFLAEIERACDRLAEAVDRLRPAPAAPVGAEAGAPVTTETAAAAPPRPALKASPDLLDRLINEAGEISIARSRLENALFHYKMTAQELTTNVERLRGQLRELEMQAETQAHARLAASGDERFDPIEFDRYTRLQELTRLMAESVDDVSTAHENLVAGLGDAEEFLVHQGRMARSLQQQLMHIRMVPLNSQAERMQRIVRQAADELGRPARLSIEGGQTEIDRTVLDKIMAPIEHLLRNAVAHGVEPTAERKAAGKPDQGHIRLVASQEGHEIVLVLEDDGAGIDLDRIRRRAVALAWLRPDEDASRERLEAFLFMPGFSTAEQVTQVAGRGVGLDVVRSEVAGIGGRVRLDTEVGRGTRFTLRLPLSLALTQVVLAVAGNRPYALPANTVVRVREVKAEAWQEIAAAGQAELDGQRYPLRALAELTEQDAAPLEGKFRTLMFLRSGEDRLALRVDRLDGNLEAVVKPIGPQLSRIVGVAGATLLGDGRVALILDPFVLAERVPALGVEHTARVLAPQPPLILVVDDSLTVRKITGRVLVKAGYRVATAKDGVEALEAIQEEMPAAMLLDIEMPRMDGFELARHLRADARTADLPVIMITSRSAEKHRQHALDLGVDAYMGKPFQDDALLAEIARLIGQEAVPVPSPAT
jgi:chemosensory pili system protein ChpA (sensor histidine kinase/response regulator)